MNRKKSFLHRLIIITILCTLLLPPFSNIVLTFHSFQTKQIEWLNAYQEKTRPLLVQAQEPTDISHEAEGMEEGFTPNTSNLHPQWNHNMMNIAQAWADGYTGAGVSIAVLDTGFFIQHPDSSMSGGYSVFADDPWSNDHSGHGTHIAGIISAQRGSTYQGIAPDAEVFGIKIYHEDYVNEDGDVSTDVKSVIKGIQYAIDLDMDIIVISSGLSQNDAELYEIIKTAHDQGIMIIAASGNGKSSVNYPAHYDEVIAVTAVDEELNPALDIIYGKENEFSAPGVNIGGLSIPDSSYSYPYIFMSGSSQAAPHAAGLAAILMQKYGTRGEEIRKIMQNQALDIGDPGLFGHGLLQYVSDEEEKNNELAPPEEETETPEEEVEEETVIPEESNEQNDPEEVKKPSSSREADTEETEDRNDLVEFYQTDIISGENLGTLERDILALVEDKGTLQINMGEMQALFLTENQLSQIRNRNISVILAKEDVLWTIPPANFVPGEAILRFYEGAPIGVERHQDSSKGIYTISIYQKGTRHDSYPSLMKVSYDAEHFNMDELLSLRPCYWDKKERKWLHAHSEIENGRFVLETKHTTAVGFLDPELVAVNTKDNSTQKDENIPEEEIKEETKQTMYKGIIAGVVLFVLLLLGIGLFIRKNNKKRE